MCRWDDTTLLGTDASAAALRRRSGDHVAYILQHTDGVCAGICKPFTYVWISRIAYLKRCAPRALLNTYAFLTSLFKVRFYLWTSSTPRNRSASQWTGAARVDEHSMFEPASESMLTDHTNLPLLPFAVCVLAYPEGTHPWYVYICRNKHTWDTNVLWIGPLRLTHCNEYDVCSSEVPEFDPWSFSKTLSL